MKEQLEVTDLKGNKIGVMNVSRIVYFYSDINVNIFIVKCATLAIHWRIFRSRLLPATLKGRSILKQMTNL